MSKCKYKTLIGNNTIGIGWGCFHVIGFILHVKKKEFSMRLGKLDFYFIWGKEDE